MAYHKGYVLHLHPDSQSIDVDIDEEEEGDDGVESVNLLNHHRSMTQQHGDTRNSRGCIRMQSEFIHSNLDEKWHEIRNILEMTQRIRSEHEQHSNRQLYRLRDSRRRGMNGQRRFWMKEPFQMHLWFKQMYWISTVVSYLF